MTAAKRPNQTPAEQQQAIQHWKESQEALERIYLFFNEVTYSLQNVKLPEKHSFRLTNQHTLHGLGKDNFVCNTKRAKNNDITAFTFRYHLSAEKNYLIKTTSREDANYLSKVLTERRIRHQRHDENPNVIPRHILFDITARITTRFIFTPIAEQGLIQLQIRNYDGKSDQTLKFKPTRIDDHLLDEIAKYALHQENEFLEMTGNRLSLGMLEKLRAKIHAEHQHSQANISGSGLLSVFKKHLN